MLFLVNNVLILKYISNDILLRGHNSRFLVPIAFLVHPALQYSILKTKSVCFSCFLLQDEQISVDKPSGGGGGLREPASLAHSAYSLAASAFSSQDTQLYINGAGLSYGYRGYPGLSAAMQHPVSLTTGAAAQSNGEEGRAEEGGPFIEIEGRWTRQSS